jgi:hypothetical protein
VNLNRVAGEFSQHNLPLQAVLGLLGFGERITAMLAELSVEDAPRVEPARHRLDLALLGLLALDEVLRVEFERRGLMPSIAQPEAPSEAHAEPTQADALRRLLR